MIRVSKILSYWKQITGVITGTAAVITIVWGLAVKHAQKNIKETSIETTVNDLSKQVNTLIISQGEFQSAVLDSISNISQGQKEQGRAIYDLTQSNTNLKNYMIKNALTKDDVIEVLDIWDVKKNSGINMFNPIQP